MKSLVGFVAIVMIAAGVVPRYLGSGTKNASTEPVRSTGLKNGNATAKAYRDSRGHFSFSARINGQRVRVLVDTGATSVAINHSTAKRAGVRFGNRGTVNVSTANGSVPADRAVLKEIQVGDIILRNVNALVVSDNALNETLLGMSFLKKLKRFEISGRTLVMVR